MLEAPNAQFVKTVDNFDFSKSAFCKFIFRGRCSISYAWDALFRGRRNSFDE